VKSSAFRVKVRNEQSYTFLPSGRYKFSKHKMKPTGKKQADTSQIDSYCSEQSETRKFFITIAVQLYFILYH
jgi:hypothetical protein